DGRLLMLGRDAGERERAAGRERLGDLEDEPPDAGRLDDQVPARAAPGQLAEVGLFGVHVLEAERFDEPYLLAARLVAAGHGGLEAVRHADESSGEPDRPGADDERALTRGPGARVAEPRPLQQERLVDRLLDDR